MVIISLKISKLLRRKKMKLDKRVIECGAVTVFLGVMAVATSVAQTKVPVRSNEVSTKIYK